MQKLVFFLSILIGINLYAQHNTANCAEFSLNVEKQVCLHLNLSKLDKRLKRNYIDLEREMFQNSIDSIANLHNNWLNFVEKKCQNSSVKCIENEYQTRLKRINFLNNYFKNRLPKPKIVNKNIKNIYAKMESAYQNHDLNFTNSNSNIDSNCLNDDYYVSVKKGMDKLFFYYYLLRVYFTDNQIYHLDKAYNDGLNLTFSNILNSINPTQFKEIIDSFKLNNFDLSDLHNALSELYTYYYKYEGYKNRENFTILVLKIGLIEDETQDEYKILQDNFYELDFPKNENSCFNQVPYLISDVNIKGYSQNAFLNSQISLDGFMYSFWYRRDIDQNKERVKEMMEYLMEFIRAYIQRTSKIPVEN